MHARAHIHTHALTHTHTPHMETQVYSEKSPLKEDETSEPAGGPFAKLNWLKAGILSADKVLTVSPNYAAEIARDESSGVVSLCV